MSYTSHNSKSSFLSECQDPSYFVNYIEWENIKITNNKYNCKKQLISNMDGFAASGRCLALMGPSGSGKTTLLNGLYGGLKGNLKLDGNIYYNGIKCKNLKYISAYIRENDNFCEYLTVYEYLLFIAHMRLGNSYSMEEKILKVTNLLEKLNILKTKDIIILDSNSTIKSLSGGERRRLTIASELLTDPKIIFADEPTNGLDASMAFEVVRILKELSIQNIIVILSVHQPSSTVYKFFDDIILLNKGNIVYSGKKEDAAEVFKRFQHAEMPTNYNPAEFYIKQISNMDTFEGTLGDSHDFKELEIIKFNQTMTDHNIQENSQNDLNKANIRFVASFLAQLKYLLLRNFKTITRNRSILTFKILQDLFIAILISCIYFRVKYNADGVRSFPGLFFFSSIAISFNSVIYSTITLPLDFDQYINDHDRGMYYSSSYFIAKILSELPIQIISNTLYILVIYIGTNLRNNIKASFLHYFVQLATFQAAYSFGYFVSAIGRSPFVATALSTPLVIPLVLIGNFMISEKLTPKTVYWIKYLSWVNYSFEALLTINLLDYPIHCPENQTGQKKCANFNYILKFFDCHPERFYNAVMMICLQIIGYRLIAIIITVARAKLNR